MKPAEKLSLRRTAFFGGSFDPPHMGHLAIARAAQAALGLDTVLFAPVGAQPLKPSGSSASFKDRVMMTGEAISGLAGFAVSLADAPREDGKPNYTLDTLRTLRGRLPVGAELFCLMGADSFFGLKSWHRAAEIPFAASLIVASRPGQQPDEWMKGLRAALPAGLTIEAESGRKAKGNNPELRTYSVQGPTGDTVPLYLLPGLYVDISASEIRERVQAGFSTSTDGRALLPAAVFDYIRAHGLYR